MARKLKRESLQALARVRLSEARSLLEGGFFGGAYYLTGVAVECALKARIASLTEQYEFPDLSRVRDSWNHDLDKLLGTAGLQEELRKKFGSDKQFEANWLTIKDWTIDTRYEQKVEREAQDIFTAATQPKHGIIGWIEDYW